MPGAQIVLFSSDYLVFDGPKIDQYCHNGDFCNVNKHLKEAIRKIYIFRMEACIGFKIIYINKLI